ncbi:LysE family translocator [Ruegeria litorea]|uniref:LysE family translocator n=1 Tax=Falsiruegeria litorea TaxID=1280831 RepID=A0ABS5WM75_9RHOB|nr:LysE family translocator [Falsiruegeria litorea]MBT3140160.1 LysE family translocator [Falsiruegeria litorea]
MLLEWDFWVFVAALSVAAFTPGPGLAAIVATTLATGARKTLWFCAGVIVGDLVWLLLSISGLAVIAQKIPLIFQCIKWAGVAYLIYLAWKIWSSPVAMGTGAAMTREKSNLARVLAGFSVTMGNPKAMLFYLALLPNLISPEHMSGPLILSLCLAVVCVLGGVFAFYMLAAQQARNKMKNSKTVRRFNRLTATALGGAAIWIAGK